MTVTKQDDARRDPDVIVDRIYEIALEPSSLEHFIDFWYDTSTGNDKDLSDFDTVYKPHLYRAQSFLQWGEAARPDLTACLRPYDNLAGFVVADTLVVEASNSGAQSAFGIRPGDTLDQLTLPEEIRSAVITAVQEATTVNGPTERILRSDLASKGGALLFRVVRIPETTVDGSIVVLVVSTHFHWRDQIGDLLSTLFRLTEAEQNVVRLLIEGHETNDIARERRTSEGTVRGQIKSIISKMNLRSQKDVIRLVMTLGDFPKTVTVEEITSLNAPVLSKNWLESEVWKPFKTVVLPDGRSLFYHDMGPSTGDPILVSHMGSCMVRWTRAMVRMAFEHNLRVICPIRAGYGQSSNAPSAADTFVSVREDCLFLLKNLKIDRLPYAVQGSDFPLAADLIAQNPALITELIGIGARPCLPDGKTIDGMGRWQKFFVSAARHSPLMVDFASKAVMAMCKRIGSEAMLRQLCKESSSDLALLEDETARQVLVANIDLMAGRTTNAAHAFAREYTAFQTDWSDRIPATKGIPVRLFLAKEDPTVDLQALPKIKQAYPWMNIEVLDKAGLALLFQRPETLVPVMAEAAKRAAAAGSA